MFPRLGLDNLLTQQRPDPRKSHSFNLTAVGIIAAFEPLFAHDQTTVANSVAHKIFGTNNLHFVTNFWA